MIVSVYPGHWNEFRYLLISSVIDLLVKICLMYNANSIVFVHVVHWSTGTADRPNFHI